MSIKNIVKGWWRWATNWTRPDWANERIKICDACEHNKKIGGYRCCALCLCNLPSKCLVKEEECHANKWPKITN